MHATRKTHEHYPHITELKRQVFATVFRDELLMLVRVKRFIIIAHRRNSPMHESVVTSFFDSHITGLEEKFNKTFFKPFVAIQKQ